MSHHQYYRNAVMEGLYAALRDASLIIGVCEQLPEGLDLMTQLRVFSPELVVPFKELDFSLREVHDGVDVFGILYRPAIPEALELLLQDLFSCFGSLQKPRVLAPTCGSSSAQVRSDALCAGHDR